jgi:rhamnose utilization protein RhaD (predicted bifunctional aldolase and dehydrogenase)/NAD(P)-dependent dehydrogenase (short-subunit alcohol dehydrogenase family)
MQSLWNPAEAEKCRDDLDLRVYSSRLLGQDASLVLHGGGNTSVKISEKNIFGEDEEILYVKGSGWDLATIEREGFTPIRLDHLLKLARLGQLSDIDMVNEMKTHQTVASAPAGSVEAILHAVLPYRYVDHSHADAIVTICNTPSGEKRIRELFGDEVVVIPYVMPGFDLARMVAEEFPRQVTDRTRGMVLMNHGLFTFANDARESYERMIELVDRAEHYLQQRSAWQIDEISLDSQAAISIEVMADLRKEISSLVGRPMLVGLRNNDLTLDFARRDDICEIALQGPATPDHVIRTKQKPMIGRDLDAYSTAYKAYFDYNAPHARCKVQMLDPAPRVILDKSMGLATVGKNAVELDIIADIYQHTVEIISRASMLEQWQALPDSDIFEVEYWELEQAKLKKTGSAPEFEGEIVLITGAASGIGKACVESFLARGAAVVGLDINPSIRHLSKKQAFLGIHCDVTNAEDVRQAISLAVKTYGGLDMLILNAGLFPGGTAIAELEDESWQKVMQVNSDANLRLLRECYPLLKRAPKYGRVAVIGSKNLLAPGPGAAAYSASKAALNQLVRVAALEWAGEGIRINSLHPDAVFDTGLWTEAVLRARAEHYKMSVEQYKKRNLLKTEITSHDVAELATILCGSLFGKTTGAQIPVDGGSDRVI